MDWAKEGVNYWENPDCPIDYLRLAYKELASWVQDMEMTEEGLNRLSREQLCKDIEFLEYVADK